MSVAGYAFARAYFDFSYLFSFATAGADVSYSITPDWRETTIKIKSRISSRTNIDLVGRHSYKRSQGGRSSAPVCRDDDAVWDTSSLNEPPVGLPCLDPFNRLLWCDAMNSSRPSGPLDPGIYLLAGKSFSKTKTQP